jgi:branched-chain amino acid transport system ATP-binding protein
VTGPAGLPGDTAVEGVTSVLEVRNLTVMHGQLRAVSDVTFSVPVGSIYAIIGANGAGKSTLLRTLAGLHRPSSGTILLDGIDITKLRADKRVAAGLSLVPEGRRLFASLSLEENLRTGLYRARPGTWTLERVYELFPWMTERRSQRAGQLSGGEQQSVAIGRALLSNPRVLLVDELSLGLAPVVVRSIYSSLPKLLDGGLTMVIVEQDVAQAARVAGRVQCLLEGRKTLEGSPHDFTAAEIEEAYFGVARPAPTRQGLARRGFVDEAETAT